MAGKKRRGTSGKIKNTETIDATDQKELPGGEKTLALETEEPRKLLDVREIPAGISLTARLNAPPIITPPCKRKQGNLKMLATIALVVLAIAVGAYIFMQPEAKLIPGTEINGATFANILSKSNTVYILMDLRNVKNENTSRNIMQCGVDFAGSPGLVGKNLGIYSVDQSGCTGLEEKTSISDCLKKTSKEIVLQIKEGNETRFYTNMMIVGIGNSYSENGCMINIKQ
jgi:hypothetical protein